jgi:Ice-binding-like/Bacterial Ig-like domain (group 3)
VLDSQAARRSSLLAVMASLLAVGALIIAVLVPRWALAATLPGLGTAGNFAVLAGSAITNTGPTVITGDLGLSPGTSVTGFPPGTVSGTSHVADAVAARAKQDLMAAYVDAAAQPATSDLTGQDLGGKTLTPGVYHFASSAQLTGTLTLDGQNNPHAVFIFQMGSTLTTATRSHVVLTHGALASGVFWQVGSSATIGTGTTLQGNLMALASITMVTGATIETGRAMALNAAVTLDTNRITRPAPPCGADPSHACKVPTITAIESSSADPSTSGQAITFTAAVATRLTSAPLGGHVTFRDGTAVLGTVPLGTGHHARFTTSALTVGDHPITATFTGNATYGPSRSHSFFQTVLAA